MKVIEVKSNGYVDIDLEKVVREEWAAILMKSELVIDENDGWMKKKEKKKECGKWRSGEQISMF